MDFDKKTFCAAPWFQIRNEQMGNYQVCCYLDSKKTKFEGQHDFSWPEVTPDQYLNSDYVKYLRKNLTQGVELSECDHCWHKERNKGRSSRHYINDTVTKNRGHDLDQTWIASYLSNKQDYGHDILLSAEIKLSNVCNFACVMCNPSDSSMIYNSWHQDQKHPMITSILSQQPDLLSKVRENYKSRNNYDLLDDVLSRRPRHLKLLGGEPLLDKTAIDRLASLPDAVKSKMTLLFITNGSVNLNDMCQRLGGFQDINYLVSLEGIGHVQDYIRKGSVWTEIENNIKDYLRQYPNKTLDVHVTVQALNIMHLPDLARWAEPLNIRLGYYVTHRPEFLTLSAIPDLLKSQIKEKLKGARLSIKDDLDLITIMDQYLYDSDLLSKMRQYLDWYDPNKKWKDIFPEWQPYL